MGLDGESPLWMGLTVLDRFVGIELSIRTVHWLEEEIVKIPILEIHRIGTILGKDDLEFIPLSQVPVRATFWAHANPINSIRRNQRAIGFNCNSNRMALKSGDQLIINLKKGFATSANDKRWFRCTFPLLNHGLCE